ncbi:hypothetical protein CPB86DRAFT_870961 [Serendipita vermifera]|nr:hypothetical protein CPB86DRAFT_870961 [Serendipita vermifera]
MSSLFNQGSTNPSPPSDPSLTSFPSLSQTPNQWFSNEFLEERVEETPRPSPSPHKLYHADNSMFPLGLASFDPGAIVTNDPMGFHAVFQSASIPVHLQGVRSDIVPLPAPNEVTLVFGSSTTWTGTASIAPNLTLLDPVEKMLDSNKSQVCHDLRSSVKGGITTRCTRSSKSTTVTQQVFDSVEGEAVASIGETGASSNLDAKRVSSQSQSSQKARAGQKRKRTESSNKEEEHIPTVAAKRARTRKGTQRSTAAAAKNPSTREEIGPVCPDGREGTVRRNGLKAKLFPSDRAAVAKHISKGSESIAELFPRKVSLGKPCWIGRRGGRGHWDQRYYCQATKQLGTDGNWESYTSECVPLSGRENYVRHIKTRHLKIPRGVTLQGWALKNM